MKIELGQMAKDTITNFRGVVVGKTTWLNGCARYGLQPKNLKDGIPIEVQWFDEGQLEIIEDSEQIEPRDNDRGGPRNDPKGFNKEY